MRLLRTIFSFILALIAIPLLTAAACNFAIEAAVFNRATYDSVLEDDFIFQQLSTSLFPLLLNAPVEDLTIDGAEAQPVQVQEIAVAFQNKPDVLSDMTNQLLPAESVQQIIVLMVDVAFAITNGDIALLDEEIDLSVIRERLNGEPAVDVAQRLITEAPRCTPQQRETLRVFLENDDGSLPICRPDDDEVLEASIAALESWLRTVGDELIGSDRVRIGDLLNISRDEARSGAIIADLLFNQILVLFLLCPIGILSLIVVLSVRRLNDFGRWIGSVSIVVGGLLILLIIGLQIFAFGTISGLLESTDNVSDVFVARLVSALLRSAINASSTSLLVQSFVFIGLGFLLFGLAWYLGQRHNDNDGDVVIITEDGQVISTATQRRIGTIDNDS